MNKNQHYIKSVHLKGYKSIRDASIDFQPGLNIIIGDNGSGKTNFLEFLYSIFRESFIIPEFQHALPFVSFDLQLCINDGINLLSVSRNKLSSGIEQMRSLLAFDRHIVKYSLPKRLFYLEDIQSFKLNKYDDGPVISLSDVISPSDSIEYSTMALLSTWHDLLPFYFSNNYDKISSSSAFIEEVQNLFFRKIGNDILSNLQKLSPIQDLRISPNLNVYKTHAGKSVENIFIEFQINNEWVPWSYLSDGTKRLFYLITEVSLTENGIVLIEEPELGIHPHQLHLLTQFLREQSETKQIIITTHSPQVLDILGPDELNRIIIAEMTKEGTKLNHLDERRMEKARRYMQDEAYLSDYWLHSDLESRVK